MWIEERGSDISQLSVQKTTSLFTYYTNTNSFDTDTNSLDSS